MLCLFVFLSLMALCSRQDILPRSTHEIAGRSPSCYMHDEAIAGDLDKILCGGILGRSWHKIMPRFVEITTIETYFSVKFLLSFGISKLVLTYYLVTLSC